MRTAVLVTMRGRYADLVRLAYLALDDGTAPPETVLAAARRAVRHAARAGPGASYRQLRHRLALELLTQPPHRRRPFLRRLLFEPQAPEPTPVREALRQASSHERLVSLLARLEELTSPEVAAELGEHLMVDAWDVDRTLTELDERTGLDAASQHAELRAFDPTLVRLRPPPSLPPTARIAIVLVAVVLIATGSTAFERWRNGGRPGDPVRVGDAGWNRNEAPGLNDWPTQGALRGDRALLRRAAAAWKADRRDPPLGKVSVMYAGAVDGATVVVMHDAPGARDAPVVAQYFERPMSRGVESIRSLHNDNGQLIMLGTTFRYLVPPWLSNLEMALPEDPRPTWRALTVRDGVTEPIPWRLFDFDCQTYIAVRMRHKAVGMVTQFASREPESATPLVWFRDSDPRRPDAGLSGDRARWTAIRALACGGLYSLSDSGDLRIGHLWSGSLPDGGGRATLLSIDAAAPWGSRGVAALISDEGRLIADRGRTNGDYSTSTDTIAGAVWWHSRKRWHLIAAGGPGVSSLKMVGELGNRDARRRGGRCLLMVPGPPVRQEFPQYDRLPVVQVVAYEPDGDHTLVSPG